MKCNIFQFKEIFSKLTGEPELEIHLKNYESIYMIIKYDNYVTFQRCGIKDGSGEIKFKDIDELLESDTIDNINLKRDFNKIENIIVDEAFDIDELL